MTKMKKNGKRQLGDLKGQYLQTLIIRKKSGSQGLLLDVLSLSRRSQYQQGSFGEVWDGTALVSYVDTLDEARGDVDTSTKNLIDSGLLLKCDEDGFVKMHDVVRDTAKLISSSGNEDVRLNLFNHLIGFIPCQIYL